MRVVGFVAGTTELVVGIPLAFVTATAIGTVLAIRSRTHRLPDIGCNPRLARGMGAVD